MYVCISQKRLEVQSTQSSKRQYLISPSLRQVGYISLKMECQFSSQYLRTEPPNLMILNVIFRLKVSLCIVATLPPLTKTMINANVIFVLMSTSLLLTCEFIKTICIIMA